jgi:hypothetical protein
LYEDNVMNAVVALAVPHTLPLARLMHIAPDRRYRCDDALSIGSVECEVAEVQIVCAPARLRARRLVAGEHPLLLEHNLPSQPSVPDGTNIT